MLLFSGCVDWVPIHNASDIPKGHALKVETSAGPEVVSHLVTCDQAGEVLARSSQDCACKDPGCTFDLRRTEVLVHKQLLSTDATLVVAIVGVLVAVAIILAAGS